MCKAFIRDNPFAITCWTESKGVTRHFHVRDGEAKAAMIRWRTRWLIQWTALLLLAGCGMQAEIIQERHWDTTKERMQALEGMFDRTRFFRKFS